MNDALDPPSDDALDGNHFEGDILGVSIYSVTSSEADNNDTGTRNAVSKNYQKWPGGSIPYVVSGYFDRVERGVIYRAMREFGELSCVRWRPRQPGETDYVHIVKDKGCYSRVGKIGRAQPLSLGIINRLDKIRSFVVSNIFSGAGCMHHGIVLHELLHAAGFWHEQSRPDRDDHVYIQWSNIERGREDNFAKYSRAEVSTLQLPYDTQSVLHYSSNAFSRYVGI